MSRGGVTTGTLGSVNRKMLLGALVLTVGVTGAACVGAAGGPAPGAAPSTVPTTAAPPEASPYPAGFDVEGHRGARGLKPENTLPAFEAGLDAGVTTLELDLHYSADGEIVIWHDPMVDASKCGLKPGAPSQIPDPDDAGSPEDDARAIRSLSVDDLRWFRCNRNPDPDAFPDQDPAPTPLAGDEYGIVTLDDLFDFVDRYADSETKTDAQRAGARVVQFNIETKRDRRDPAAIGDGFDGETVGPFEQRLLQVVDERGLRDRVIIQSFDIRSLQAIDAADPGIRLAVLTATGHAALPAFADTRPVVWSPRASTVDAASVDAAHAGGHTVVPWTVNDVEEAERLIELGVDGLITDRPDLLVAQQ